MKSSDAGRNAYSRKVKHQFIKTSLNESALDIHQQMRIFNFYMIVLKEVLIDKYL